MPTKNNEMSIYLDTPDGHCIGILFDFVDGKEPSINKEDMDKQYDWLLHWKNLCEMKRNI